jgi:hypothetical protein
MAAELQLQRRHTTLSGKGQQYSGEQRRAAAQQATAWLALDDR